MRPDGQRRELFVPVLALVLATAVFITATPDNDAMRLVTVGLSAATLVGAALAAGADPRLVRGAFVLSGLALLASLIAVFTDVSAVILPLLLSAVLAIAAPVVLARGAAREIRARGVTIPAVAAAISVYLLLGMFFSLVIGTIAEFGDAPYFGAQGDGSRSIDLYFSYVTLATIGYGDFAPATSVGRALAMLEGVLGQLYLVTIISLLVANVRRPGDRARVTGE